MKMHLSSEAMERLLAGKADAATMEHVSGCAACAEETARMSAMLGAFRESAVEVAAMERRRAVVAGVGSARRLSVWATGAVAVVIAAVMVPVVTRHEVVTPQAPVVANAQAGAAAVSDAELMAKIQDDLASNVPGPMQALEGRENQTGSRHGSSSNTNSNEKD
ncbi:MAG: hypothetical protein V4555_08940 [Acidobacteriota bacterium]